MDLPRKGLFSLYYKLGFNTTSPYLQCRNYAARKGTRAKADRKKVKVEVKKVGFVPHQKDKSGKILASKKVIDHDTKIEKPVDNVWIAQFYQLTIFDFDKAVENHRETHHPQIYNYPDAPLRVHIEMNMAGVKKNKYVEPFTRISKAPNPFDHGEERSTLVFCKSIENQEEARSAGATLVGDADKGDIMLPDFQFILAHPDILAELVSLKGLLKRRFPSPKTGTLNANIGEIVTKFKTGINYSALKSLSEPQFGWVDTQIGTLDMKTEHLEENFKCLLEDINQSRPKREGPFILKAFLTSEPSSEKFKLNITSYIEEEQELDSDSDDELQEKKN